MANTIKRDDVRPLTVRIEHAIRRGMVGDYSYTTDAAVIACEDRERIWERAQQLHKKNPLAKSLAIAQLEFVENAILDFLNQNGLLEVEEVKDAEIRSDSGEENEGSEAETQKIAV